jgi:hypothetical protein
MLAPNPGWRDIVTCILCEMHYLYIYKRFVTDNGHKVRAVAILYAQKRLTNNLLHNGMRCTHAM